MSELRTAAERIADMGRFPTQNPERKLESERAAARLGDLAGGGAVRSKEPWDAFLRRIGVIDG